jgi:hypothetical protein
MRSEPSKYNYFPKPPPMNTDALGNKSLPPETLFGVLSISKLLHQSFFHIHNNPDIPASLELGFVHFFTILNVTQYPSFFNGTVTH